MHCTVPETSHDHIARLRAVCEFLLQYGIWYGEFLAEAGIESPHHGVTAGSLAEDEFVEVIRVILGMISSF